MWLVVSTLFSPLNAFDRLKQTDYLYAAVLLTAIRWVVTPVNTVWRMYDNESPMLFSPLFGLDAKTYRYYEIYWYGPYGVFIMLIITYCVYCIAWRFDKMARPTFRKTFELVSLCFFTPWLVSVIGDPILVHTVNASPLFLVPFHIGILTVECFLMSLGFSRMYELPFWRRCTFLGFVAGFLFMAMGGPAIR